MRALVENLKLTGDLREAFLAVDRKDFMNSEENAYVDEAFDIGYGQTISQPYTVAFMLKKLGVQKGEHVLDVGSGSGWTTALLAHLVGPKGRVVGVERIPELVEMGQRNLAKYQFHNAIIQESSHGWPEDGPYDKILVSAATDQLPDELFDQLKIGGRIVIPMRGSLWQIEYLREGLKEKEFPGFSFVPYLTQ